MQNQVSYDTTFNTTHFNKIFLRRSLSNNITDQPATNHIVLTAKILLTSISDALEALNFGYLCE